MNLRPLHDRVVLRRLEVPQTSEIVIPESLKEESTFCEVVAVGPGRRFYGANGKEYFQPTVLKPGEKVIIGPYCDLEWDGEKLLICQEADVRAVVNG